MSCTVSPAVRSGHVTPLTPQLVKMMPSIADHVISNHVIKNGGVSPNTQSAAQFKNNNCRNNSTSGLAATSSSAVANAKNYYNPAKNSVYSRYSTTEWDLSNKNQFSLSDRERNLAERLRTDAFRAVRTTDQITRSRQASNTKKLGVRVFDISFWKEELLKEINLIDHETANLEEHKRLLERAYSETKSPLSIATDCLTRREARTGIDLVHDDVERALSKEVDIIRKCQNKMQKVLDRASAQVKMNRAAQKVCEGDMQGKHHAQALDDRMQQLRNSSSRLGFYPGIENVDNTVSVPQSWMRYTQENIGRCQREREISERLRGEIDSCLRSCANEMWNQFNTVNNAFNCRIQETNNAKNALQAHLQRTNNELRDMERSIDLLRKAIHDKENPMKVAQTRLDERTRRIDVELCNDPVMIGLQKEIVEIRENVKMLKEKLRSALNSAARLHKARAALENDISVKENSLEIDVKGCMGLRKNMSLDPKVGPIFSMPLVY